LVHAIVWSQAEAAGIRALAIKGLTLQEQGLRLPRLSADVDVLVHPQDHAEMLAQLAAIGWRRSVMTTNARVLIPHSADLVSDYWPVSIDLHHYFPGFLEDPGAVFDVLWERHERIKMAAVDVPVCDHVAHAALYALHLLRDQPGDTLTRELDQLAITVRRFSGSDRHRFAGVVARTGATETLAPFLVAVGIELSRPSRAVDAQALARWRRRTRSGSFDGWIAELGRTSPVRWPSVVRRAILLTDDELRAYHSGGRDVSLRRLRWERLIRIGRRVGRRGRARLARALDGSRGVHGVD
jgi:hypothetical protein